MRAIIPAAGLGRRLGTLSASRPKCLLEIGGMSLLARSLDHLEDAGITRTVIVIGHAAAEIEAAAGARDGRMAVETLRTPDYQSRGSMGSVLTAVEETGLESTLLVESDLLYHPQFLAAAAENSISAILTAEVSGSGDEVYVCSDDRGMLAYLGKAATAEQKAASPGEFAGISLLQPATLALFAETARIWLAGGRVDAHYEEVLLALAVEGHAIRVRHCPGLPWTEIDNPADMVRAKTRIWPRLAPVL